MFTFEYYSDSNFSLHALESMNYNLNIMCVEKIHMFNFGMCNINGNSKFMYVV